MTIVLLVISMAFHLLTFFVFILFYQQQQKLKEERRELYDMREDLEELLESCTADIKKENEELKHLFDERSTSNLKQEQAVFPTNTNEHLTTVEKNEGQSQKYKDKEQSFHEQASSPLDPSFENYSPLTEQKTEDTLEQSSQAQVLSLASQGYKQDEIAKKLNMGKGEVDLLLKFYHK
ncbi:DUF6115 domain-containing protein [Alteribacillus bidgolensis]|uniref:Uncharacterized protein n=1 Tax=Alteribacillus bidgolensis TaxID=930129 RepID=A0A1G8GG93_9BACI|nr:hypothetical protein [Alteribacillus bidgolensis]SDH93394.1 hypothetical protein SAMN05216352_103388 [Alteribacillus bidgolensis]